MLAQAFPGRFVLGLGVGYPDQAAAVGRDFNRPLATMSAYLDEMYVPQAMTPAPGDRYPRIVAAGGPKMLYLAGRDADGALPTLVPPEYTRRARQELGPDKLLVIGLSVAADADPDRAKAVAQHFATAVISRPGSPYAVNLARLGYTSEELSVPADRLVDDVIGYGDARAIAAKVQEHLDAGADHVRIATIADDFGTGVDQLEELGAHMRL
ncbi:LLM class flavin-dependent oxidoreductase [Williamsia sp. 1135]|uniref:LLM class flavin-dependent oxidoreductase n=1 Tax=Williamsia sp. 1135 TaxID=1889262 RepID=UPI001F0B0F23|nr:LLM class flavin-dependent oxidoreductase [Williamsia sp. 1135]